MTSVDYDLTDLDSQLAPESVELALSTEAQEMLFLNARTANAFTDEPVSDAQLRAVYDLVKWAPTALNTQPLRVLLVRSREARERLVAHMSEGNKAKTLAAPLVAVLAADRDFHHRMDRTTPHAPAARDSFDADPDRRSSAATTNATLQAAYFLIGVRAAGLAAGPMGGFDADGVSREFFPDGDHRALLVVNIGKPAQDAYRPRGVRLDYDEVMTTV